MSAWKINKFSVLSYITLDLVFGLYSLKCALEKKAVRKDNLSIGGLVC